MPPGLSREHVKKRKASSPAASEGSDELGMEREEEEEVEEDEQPPELNISGRQRRSAAMKTHKAWDVLKPGAKMHVEEETTTEQSNESPSATKKPRQTQKRKAPMNSPNAMEEGANTEGTEETQQKQQLSIESPTKQRVMVSKSMSTTTTTSSANMRVIQVLPQPAKNKDQLQLIEKEMEEHHQYAEEQLKSNADEPSDDDEEDNGTVVQNRVLLDDPNDEDYPEFPSRGGRGGRGRGESSQRGRGGGGRGRGRGMGSAYPSMRGGIPRGRPRGSRAATGGGVMRGRVSFSGMAGGMSKPPMSLYPPPRSGAGGLINGPSSGGIYSLHPTGGILGDLVRPPVRIVRPRPAGMPCYRPLQAVRPPPLAEYNETAFQINRELENYRNSIVPGSSVQQFNDIIDQILQELSRVAEERDKLIASHREYVDHLQLTHTAAQEIKDNRIRQLEQSLAYMQQKLMVSFKQEQAHLVKNNTEGGSSQEVGGESQQQQQQQMKMEQGDVHQGPQPPQSSNSQMEGLRPAGSNIRQLYPTINQQRVRIMPSQQPPQLPAQPQQAHHHLQGLNSPYDDEPYEDDDLDDEEDFEEDYDEGDSADIDDDLGAQVTI